MKWKRFIHKNRYMCNKGLVCKDCGVHNASVKGLCQVCYNNRIYHQKAKLQDEEK